LTGELLMLRADAAIGINHNIRFLSVLKLTIGFVGIVIVPN
jgi:hypothetical protein